MSQDNRNLQTSWHKKNKLPWISLGPKDLKKGSKKDLKIETNEGMPRTIATRRQHASQLFCAEEQQFFTQRIYSFRARLNHRWAHRSKMPRSRSCTNTALNNNITMNEYDSITTRIAMIWIREHDVVGAQVYSIVVLLQSFLHPNPVHTY